MTRLVAPLGTDLSKSYGEGGGGGEIFELHEFFFTFPFQEYFFRMQEHFFLGYSLCMNFFLSIFPCMNFLLFFAPPP